MEIKKSLAKLLIGGAFMLLMLSVAGISMAAEAGASLFTDVNASTPHYNAIKYLKDHGVIGGYPDGSFKPNQVVNRAEALKIILLGSGITVDSSVSEKPFTDVEADVWYAVYVKKAKDLAVVSGYADGTFKPSQTVNLVENLKILLLTTEAELSGEVVLTNPYADAFASEWYAKYVQYSKEKHFIDSDNDNMIYPAQGMTRATLAETIYRLMYTQENELDVYVEVQIGGTQETEETQQPTQETQQPTQETEEVSCKISNATSVQAYLDGGVTAMDTVVTLDFTGWMEDMVNEHPLVAGNTLVIGDELLLVLNYDQSTNTATVLRGFGKTTAAAHSDEAGVQLSGFAYLVTNIRSGSKQFMDDTSFSVVDNTSLLAGSDVAVLSDDTDLEYEHISSFNAGTNWNVTRALYGTTAIEHEELVSMIIQFSQDCDL